MADDLSIELRGLEQAINGLSRVTHDSEKVMGRTMFRIATMDRDTSQKYAPRSPTLTDLRKATGRAYAIRKDRGTSRPKPGGLERSIEFEATAQDAVIYVASNAEAGKYAFKMHELKGTAWNNRGIGTVSKGAKADDRFIVRAILDRAGDALKIVENEQAKAVNL